MSRMPMTAFRLDNEHRQLLELTAQHERLSMADTVRRAIRFYAASVGVKLPQAKRAKKPTTK